MRGNSFPGNLAALFGGSVSRRKLRADASIALLQIIGLCNAGTPQGVGNVMAMVISHQVVEREVCGVGDRTTFLILTNTSCSFLPVACHVDLPWTTTWVSFRPNA
jgi:hypothetical protein